MAAPGAKQAEITEELLSELRENLVERRIEAGMRALDRQGAVLQSFRHDQKNAALFVSALAQWVDVGYRDAGEVQRLLQCFPAGSRKYLPLCDFLAHAVARGQVAMADENTAEAISLFDLVLALASDVRYPESVAIVHFWKSRCLRMKGEYDAALEEASKGRQVAADLGHPRMAAVIRVLESWLHFQKGRTRDAIAILNEAEKQLAGTDDYLTLGNIYSAYGRMFRREGRYDRALENFERAIVEYRRRDPEHRNVARTLSNMGYVKRLIALHLSNRIDAGVARRHKAKAAGERRRGSTITLRQRVETLRNEAFVELDQAAAIYERQPNTRGAATVHLNRGLLLLDAGDFTAADREAAEAFRIGEEKKDYFVLARARLLECMAENGRFEEQVEEHEDPRRHAQAAQAHARQAVEFAEHTQNGRLLARTLVWLGLTYCNDLVEDVEAARQCCDRAAEVLKAGSHDDVAEELQALRARIMRAGSVDSQLRAWSQGVVGNRTFQQVTEEFAELVIPKVWLREGKKVSRVAAKLSVSPKKVRRILRRSGLLSPGNGN